MIKHVISIHHKIFIQAFNQEKDKNCMFSFKKMKRNATKCALQQNLRLESAIVLKHPTPVSFGTFVI
jgi:hypothetical protein